MPCAFIGISRYQQSVCDFAPVILCARKTLPAQTIAQGIRWNSCIFYRVRDGQFITSGYLQVKSQFAPRRSVTLAFHAPPAAASRPYRGSGSQAASVRILAWMSGFAFGTMSPFLISCCCGY
jgi:hypothetical protein